MVAPRWVALQLAFLLVLWCGSALVGAGLGLSGARRALHTFAVFNRLQGGDWVENIAMHALHSCGVTFACGVYCLYAIFVVVACAAFPIR